MAVDNKVAASQHGYILFENVKGTKMKAPMVLPWLARKWDVSDARALELWRQACRDAEKTTGERSSSRYWGAAKSRLIELLDNEINVDYPGMEAPWIMLQLNLSRLFFWIGVKGHLSFPVFRP